MKILSNPSVNSPGCACAMRGRTVASGKGRTIRGGRLLKPLLLVGASIGLAPLVVHAEGAQFLAESVMSSAVMDRGEQISGLSLEMAAAVELPAGDSLFYGAVYRRAMLDDKAVFEDEADYSVGMIWAGAGYVVDVSANWLTYPGEVSRDSLEFDLAVELDMPMSPTFLGFYDVHTEDYGVEVSGGPEWGVGRWSYYAIGRGGSVVPGDGSKHRTYAGLEFGTGYAVTQTAELGAFLRWDYADKDSFVDDVNNTGAATVSRSGIAAGIALSLSL